MEIAVFPAWFASHSYTADLAPQHADHSTSLGTERVLPSNHCSCWYLPMRNPCSSTSDAEQFWRLRVEQLRNRGNTVAVKVRSLSRFRESSQRWSQQKTAHLSSQGYVVQHPGLGS